MEDASEKFSIQLRIDTRPYPVRVRRDEEEIYREAERLINDKLNVYRAHFPTLPNEQYLYMTLLDISVRLIKAERHNDTMPYKEIMSKLTEEIMSTLGDNQ